MKKYVLCISIGMALLSCTPIERKSEIGLDSLAKYSDTIRHDLQFQDTMFQSLLLNGDSLDLKGDSIVPDDIITPELRREYIRIKNKMIQQQPRVRTVGDGFEFDLTKEEWEVYWKVQNHKSKTSQKSQPNK